MEDWGMSKKVAVFRTLTLASSSPPGTQPESDVQSFHLHNSTHLPLGLNALSWGEMRVFCLPGVPTLTSLSMVFQHPTRTCPFSPFSTWMAHSFSSFIILIQSNKALEFPVYLMWNALFLRWISEISSGPWDQILATWCFYSNFQLC